MTALHKSKLKFFFVVPILDKVTYTGDSYFMAHWGYRKDFDLEKDVIITSDFIKKHPKLLSG